MVRVFFIVLLLFTFSRDAQAIACHELNEKEIQNIYYVGILKIIDSKKNAPIENSYIPVPSGYTVTVKPLHSLNDNNTSENIEVLDPGAIDGWRSSGNMFVDFIIKNTDKAHVPYNYYFKNLCNVRSEMKRLGYEIKEPLNEAYMIEERACEAEGKEMYLIGKTVNCIEPEVYAKELADCKARGGSLQWLYGQPSC